MAHIFSFSILEAVPDASRGERVNIGIVVLLNESVDVRLSEVAKLRALREGNWDDYLGIMQAQFAKIFVPGDDIDKFVRRASLIEGVIRFSDPSTFSVDHTDQYEGRIKDILEALVTRPRTEKKAHQTRINTEIANTFRTAQVLARPGDTLDEGSRVFPNYPISAEEELSADFLLKNGVYHVTVTLDLRRIIVNKAQAALKAVVLHKSAGVLTGSVQKIAVYAAADVQQYRPHIGILSDYADHGCVFNWLDPEQRRKYTHSIYDAIAHPDALDFTSRPRLS